MYEFRHPGLPARLGKVWDCDGAMYEWPHRIENFAKIKKHGAIAMRYDEADASHAAFRRLAAAMIDHKMNANKPWMDQKTGPLTMSANSSISSKAAKRGSNSR